MKKNKEIDNRWEGESWYFFGLSHSHWLVLPRIALQSMPYKWQKKFFNMVEEIYETLEMPEGYTGDFVVTMIKNNKFTKHVIPEYRHNLLPEKS